MKCRLVDGVLLCDFNYRGWNPEEIIEMNDKQYQRFKEISEEYYDWFDDMELKDLIDVLVMMAIDGDIRCFGDIR